MTYSVHVLPRAEQDVDAILSWLREQSRAGAVKWYRAYEAAIRALDTSPERHGLAPENDVVTYEVRQFLFKTARGRTYRGLFMIHEHDVFVLRVRSAGQAPVDPREL